MKLSLAVATHNEEGNIRACIESCKGLVEETVVVDGSSTDNTVKIAERLGARVIHADNPRIFHINKQKAIDACQGEWILQLDADERVTPELAGEIRRIISMDQNELKSYQQNLPERELFLRHEKVSGVTENNGQKDKPIEAFFIPRLNYFLGTYLRHGGVYPDGVIRLFRKGKAHLPCKDVHELMKVDGAVGWLQYPLLHVDSPTFTRYLERNSRYIDHIVEKLKTDKTPHTLGNFADYMFMKPLAWFFSTTVRHKGILDGVQGIILAFFSALRFPRAWARYLSDRQK